MDRMIATSRLKAFFEKWLDENWEEDDLRRPDSHRRGTTLLAFRAGVQPRAVNRILYEESANAGFDFVDRVFTNLDCVHLWHLPPEDGGFSDYYQDEAPEPAPKSIEQARFCITENAKRSAKKSGMCWLDVLHERALEEVAA